MLLTADKANLVKLMVQVSKYAQAVKPIVLNAHLQLPVQIVMVYFSQKTMNVSQVVKINISVMYKKDESRTMGDRSGDKWLPSADEKPGASEKTVARTIPTLELESICDRPIMPIHKAPNML